MTGTLTPADLSVLISTTQDVFVDADVTAVGFDSITLWEWDIVAITPGAPDNPPNFVVTVSDPPSLTLNVSYENYDDLFALQNLRYLRPDLVPVNVSDFGDLPPPEDSPEILAMIASAVTMIVWEITVSATGDQTGAEGVTTLTYTYTINIEVNYDINRDNLLAEIALRS